MLAAMSLPDVQQYATDLVVFDDLGDEVAGVGHVGHDGHAHAQGQHVWELLQQVLDNSLQAAARTNGGFKLKPD